MWRYNNNNDNNNNNNLSEKFFSEIAQVQLAPGNGHNIVNNYIIIISPKIKTWVQWYK